MQQQQQQQQPHFDQPQQSGIGNVGGKRIVLERVIEFRPTEAEFKNPMKYISSIKSKASKFGICKIIPPSDKWLQGKSFMRNVDPKSFLFPTKLQTIHKLALRNNAPVAKFMEDLERFCKEKSITMTVPVIDGQELDLYRLFKSVAALGGLQKVRSFILLYYFVFFFYLLMVCD